ncbi:hypothetical protein DB347_04250 [Opitutaceae bacterium EW11]|nr:hypothetical protein DB347_04250 [Opitutaceae bacterium EW11]
MNRFLPFTSVTRWLLVVIGCVVLATAQPMRAASSDATAPDSRKADTIIYPKGSAEKPAGVADPNEHQGSGSYVLVVALILAAVGAWVLIQRRKGAPLVSRGPRKLQLEETRPLGNRQYLVVANYDGRKFLLGVTTGQIQLLSELGVDKTAEAGEGEK